LALFDKKLRKSDSLTFFTPPCFANPLQYNNFAAQIIIKTFVLYAETWKDAQTLSLFCCLIIIAKS
ncbi:MAG: hypothetical protein SO001_04335, partial [Alloprevotella sp.]|nr:hypothetical protein [Alloprevotella sp.]